MKAMLTLTRDQILAARRRAGALESRLPPGTESLRTAAWAGLQDSMPRAALLSIHARVEGVGPDILDDPSLIQLWGPRYSAFTVAEVDRALFSLSRLPDGGKALERAETVAASLAQFLDGRKMGYRDAGNGMGVPPNRLRYAATTGTVVMRWDGARQPLIWTVPRPEMSPGAARSELARRYLHVYGPADADAFTRWAGITSRQGVSAFEALGDSLLPVRTPIGDRWILGADEPALLADAGPEAPARLLPSGDTYFLFQGRDREILVPDAGRRPLLWTPRVWPGAVLVEGEIVGTWRRDKRTLTVEPWRRLTADERNAVEVEAASLPLPGVESGVTVIWSP
jgi:hypothetical protein